MTNLPPSTAEERARWKELCDSWRSSDEFVGNVARTALPRLLADIERLEAVAEAARRYVETTKLPQSAEMVRCCVQQFDALRQALAESGKL